MDRDARRAALRRRPPAGRSPGHPLHGAVVELVRPLPALRATLAFAVQRGAEQALLPVHTSDVLDYVWPKLTSVSPVEWPTCAAVHAGTAEGLAPPRGRFTVSSPREPSLVSTSRNTLPKPSFETRTR